MDWACPRCGAGQVLQLEVNSGLRTSDLHSILGGMVLREEASAGIEGEFRPINPRGPGHI